MTMKQLETLKAAEMKKLETLEAIVKMLEELKKASGDDAVEWVMEKLND